MTSNHQRSISKYSPDNFRNAHTFRRGYGEVPHTSTTKNHQLLSYKTTKPLSSNQINANNYYKNTHTDIKSAVGHQNTNTCHFVIPDLALSESESGSSSNLSSSYHSDSSSSISTEQIESRDVSSEESDFSDSSFSNSPSRPNRPHQSILKTAPLAIENKPLAHRSRQPLRLVSDPNTFDNVPKAPKGDGRFNRFSEQLAENSHIPQTSGRRSSHQLPRKSSARHSLPAETSTNHMRKSSNDFTAGVPQGPRTYYPQYFSHRPIPGQIYDPPQRHFRSQSEQIPVQMMHPHHFQQQQHIHYSRHYSGPIMDPDLRSYSRQQVAGLMPGTSIEANAPGAILNLPPTTPLTSPGNTHYHISHHHYYASPDKVPNLAGAARTGTPNHLLHSRTNQPLPTQPHTSHRRPTTSHLFSSSDSSASSIPGSLLITTTCHPSKGLYLF